MDLSMMSMLIVGGSRGIGAAAAAHYAPLVRELFTVSRGPSAHGTWLECDVTQPDAVGRLAQAVGSQPLDALLYLGGTWEANAFTAGYRFAESSLQETQHVIAVNLIAPIWLTQILLPQLQASSNPKVVFIGSMSALDNTASKEVANSASKYGLRGAAQALERALKGSGISTTVINPGKVATPEVLDDVANGAFGAQVPIPMEDLLAVLDCVLMMSKHPTLREVNLLERFGA